MVLLYIGVTSSILIGYKHTANSCLLCFSYVIPTNNRFYTCRIDVIPTDNSFMHAEVTSPNTLTSSLISFVMVELSSGICIIKQLLDEFEHVSDNYQGLSLTQTLALIIIANMLKLIQ